MSKPSCKPGEDFISSALPDKDDTAIWADLPGDIDPQSLRYIVYDNNQLVRTYIQEIEPGSFVVKGTLGDRRPSRHWNPKIRDGYYYLKKDEHYLFIDKHVITLPDDIEEEDLPIFEKSSTYDPLYPGEKEIDSDKGTSDLDQETGGYFGTWDAPEYDPLGPLWTTDNVPDDIKQMQKHTLEFHYPIGRLSPILITKVRDLDGITIPLRQVGFSRQIDNRYVTYNTERIVLDGTRYIRLSYADIDPKFTITIEKPDGSQISCLDSNPKDNIIEMAVYQGFPSPHIVPMPPGEALALKGTEVRVTYQPKNCYVINYNTLSGKSVQITFSEAHTNLKIFHESSMMHSHYWAMEAEFNPIRTPIPSSFLYIASEDKDLAYVRIRAYPNKLIADGHSRAIVIVETIDIHGNPCVDSVISAQATKGLLEEYPDDTEIPTLKQMAGRTIFTYTVPASITDAEEEDKIIIEDDRGVLRECILTLVKEDV